MMTSQDRFVIESEGQAHYLMRLVALREAHLRDPKIQLLPAAVRKVEDQFHSQPDLRVKDILFAMSGQSEPPPAA